MAVEFHRQEIYLMKVRLLNKKGKNKNKLLIAIRILLYDSILQFVVQGYLRL